MDMERKDKEGDELGKMVEATKPLTEKVGRATKQAYVLGHGRRWTYRPLSWDVLPQIFGSVDLRTSEVDIVDARE
jgi:hypothetical protein